LNGVIKATPIPVSLLLIICKKYNLFAKVLL